VALGQSAAEVNPFDQVFPPYRCALRSLGDPHPPLTLVPRCGTRCGAGATVAQSPLAEGARPPGSGVLYAPDAPLAEASAPVPAVALDRCAGGIVFANCRLGRPRTRAPTACDDEVTDVDVGRSFD
jgi:hypothetical protein